MGIADASVVKRLAPQALYDGADLVVEGRVTASSSRWNADHTGLETTVTIAVDEATKGASRALVELVQPGGELAGMRHVIVGMPQHIVGQHARFYLRETASGRYRVFGWKQGVWPAVQDARSTRFEMPVLSAFEREDVVHFTHNGMLWNPEQVPVAYRIHEVGSDDISLSVAKDAIFAAFATWQDVPCSSLRYSYQGETSLGMAVDDTNVVMWIESEWIYGAEAAGAASLFFAPGETPTVDVAFNGENFSWAIGPISVGIDIQDVQGVLTHELGHFSGLSHTESSIDTMNYSWTPWQSQRSLSADDKLGLCELYPARGDECVAGENCSDGSPCETYERGTLCSPIADPTGTDCNYDRIDCDGFCLFTTTDLSEGYCSKFCEADNDCPDRFACNEASAGEMPVKVCFRDDTSRRPDAGPMEGSCVDTVDCEQGQHCGSDGFCLLECREDFDCSDSAHECTSDGRCGPPQRGGCGCSSGGAPAGAPWFLLAFFGLWARRFSRSGASPSRVHKYNRGQRPIHC
ncbi:MAG: matrixin family metalloprotease [Myxococcales bacterium]|nr:matrixin family metalloprotease [Myxococcales bacterium]